MISTFQDPQRFILITVIVYPLCGLLILWLWWVVGRRTKTPRPASYLRMLALWLIFSPLVLCALQFVFPALTMYFLYLPFGEIVIFLYLRYSMEKNDFLHPVALGASIIDWIVVSICVFVTLPRAVSNILIALTHLDPFFVSILADNAPLAWYMLNLLIIWMYGKKKQWNMAPLFAIVKADQKRPL